MAERTLLPLSLALVCLVAASSGTQDAPGSRDHPLVTRYAGSDIVHYQEREFDELLLPLGAHDDAAEPTETERSWYRRGGLRDKRLLEGKVTSVRYRAPAERSTLEVFRNYERALEGAGFDVLFRCAGAECGDEFPRTYYGRPGGRGTTNTDFLGIDHRYLAARLARPEGDVYVAVFVLENNMNYLSGHAVVQLDVVETVPMEEGLVAVDAASMLRQIQADGRIALYGIHFDTGSAEILPASEPALSEIATLLRDNPQLRLYVVGHTDNRGSYRHNAELSTRRAEAVVATLASAHGVDSERLMAYGVAFLAPVASNDDERGRALNRRVELVKQ